MSDKLRINTVLGSYTNLDFSVCLHIDDQRMSETPISNIKYTRDSKIGLNVCLKFDDFKVSRNYCPNNYSGLIRRTV